MGETEMARITATQRILTKVTDYPRGEVFHHKDLAETINVVVSTANAILNREAKAGWITSEGRGYYSRPPMTRLSGHDSDPGNGIHRPMRVRVTNVLDNFYREGEVINFREVAEFLGEDRIYAVSGQLSWMRRYGKLDRIKPGYYIRPVVAKPTTVEDEVKEGFEDADLAGPISGTMREDANVMDFTTTEDTGDVQSIVGLDGSLDADALMDALNRVPDETGDKSELRAAMVDLAAAIESLSSPTEDEDTEEPEDTDGLDYLSPFPGLFIITEATGGYVAHGDDGKTYSVRELVL